MCRKNKTHGLCLIYFSENCVIRTSSVLFVIEKGCVYCVVRTGSLLCATLISYFKGLNKYKLTNTMSVSKNPNKLNVHKHSAFSID